MFNHPSGVFLEFHIFPFGVSVGLHSPTTSRVRGLAEEVKCGGEIEEKKKQKTRRTVIEADRMMQEDESIQENPLFLT